MKKKIGELTLRDTKKICETHKCSSETCPYYFICMRIIPSELSEEILNQEIEVQKDE